MRKALLDRHFVIVFLIVTTMVCGILFGVQGETVFAGQKDSDGKQDFAGYVKGSMDESAPAPSVSSKSKRNKKLKVALPESYDSRDHGNVTPVRNQKSLNLCWSFATIAAVESSLLAHGQVSSADKLDLSERQLAYFSFHVEPDAMGNTEGDETQPIRSNYIENYGNIWITTETMASGIGVANETDVPTFDDMLTKWISAGQKWTDDFAEKTKLDPALARGANSWRLSSAKRISVKDKDSIKQAIMDDGAVAVLTMLDVGLSGTSWNRDNAAYYNYEWNDSNHLITIVGWDDKFSRENFTDYSDEDQPIPEHDGAWICKNSYGPDWKKLGGYYWLSYDDCYFTDEGNDVAAYAFEMKPASDNEILYQYDGSASDAYIDVPSGGSVANMFEVKGASGKNEVLKSVSLSMLYDTNVDYSIQIYTDCENKADPASGTPALTKPQTGKTTYAGFHTIDLDEAVDLKEGSTFSVVVTLSHDSSENAGESVKYDVDATYETGGFLAFKSKVMPDQSFTRKGESAKWNDLSGLYDADWEKAGCAARIKAMTVPVGAEHQDEPKDISGAEVKVKDLSYNGKARKPEVKVTLDGEKLKKDTDFQVVYKNNISVGKGSVIITGIGAYKGTKKTAFCIDPKGTSLTKKAAGKKKMTIKWKKQTLKMSSSRITGYQIQYSTNKKFKNGRKIIPVKGATRSKHTISKLKSRKTYYVRIRTYKKVGKVNYCSSWSKRKTVKIK